MFKFLPLSQKKYIYFCLCSSVMNLTLVQHAVDEPDLHRNSIISTNDCTCIPTACFWGSLKFHSLLKCTVAWGLFIWRAVPLGRLINLPCSLCLSQRSQPEGGAALPEWEGQSHAESPELFHLKSPPQSLLPGRAEFPMRECVVGQITRRGNYNQ